MSLGVAENSEIVTRLMRQETSGRFVSRPGAGSVSAIPTHQIQVSSKMD